MGLDIEKTTREITVTEEVEEYVLRMNREEVEVFFTILQFIGGSPTTSDRGIAEKWLEDCNKAGITINTVSDKRAGANGYSVNRNVNRDYAAGSVTFYK